MCYCLYRAGGAANSTERLTLLDNSPKLPVNPSKTQYLIVRDVRHGRTTQSRGAATGELPAGAFTGVHNTPALVTRESAGASSRSRTGHYDRARERPLATVSHSTRIRDSIRKGRAGSVSGIRGVKENPTSKKMIYICRGYFLCVLALKALISGNLGVTSLIVYFFC